MPRPLRFGLAVAALGIFTSACEPTPMGPGTVRYGALRIQPVLQSAVDPGRLGLDSIRVMITEADDGSPVADTVLSFDADAETILAWVLGLEELPAVVNVEATVFRTGTAMFQGSLDVEVVETSASGTATQVDLAFIGPGANAATLAVSPVDSLLTFGDVVEYTVTAADADGQLIPDAVAVWTSSDPALASIDDDGRLEVPDTRGAVVVTAETPTGVTGTADARFQPTAGEIEVVSGDGATAPVASVLRLEVRVLGSDGLPVEGALVMFSAPGGASVSTPTATTDVDGIAATDATLGSVAGTQVFTAEVAGVPEAALEVMAEAGPAASLVFETEPSNAGIDEEIAPAVTVGALDAFGNRPDTTFAISLSLGTNPSAATLSGTTNANTLHGVATFADLKLDRSGTGFTVVASAAGLPPVGSAPFDVLGAPESVVVTPDAATLTALGSTINLAATAFDAANQPISGQSFVWTSEDPDIAEVSADGTVTAVANGTTTVIVSAGTASDSATITVQQEAVNVIVTPNQATLDALEAQVQLAALVLDANDYPLANQHVTWNASPPGIVDVDNAGLVRAVANGDATIEAVSGAAVGSASITVRQVIVSVTVTPGVLSFSALQDEEQLSAVGYDANGYLVSDAVFSWMTDDAGIADVDATGLVTATGNGTADVTATADQSSATSTVSVAQVATQLEVLPSADTITAVNGTTTLNAVARDANGFPVGGTSPTWTSLDPLIVSVDQAGVVTALAAGDALVEAVEGNLADTAQITVRQEVTTVLVTPASISIDALDDVVSASAEGRDANGFPVTGLPVTWSSDDDATATVDPQGDVTPHGNGATIVRAMIGASRASPQCGSSNRPHPHANGQTVANPAITRTSLSPFVATVDSDGVVTAIGNGTAVIRATGGNAVAETQIVVEQRVVNLSIDQELATLSVAESVQLTATAVDTNGFTVDDAQLAWRSLNAGVADVSAGGLLSAVAPGSTSIEAEADGITSFVSVAVQ